MMRPLEELAQLVSSFPVDRDSVPQERLDVRERERKSLYPWRGQFSPGLVDLLLGIYAREDTIILDPFVGSGTTLFEAASRGLECHGTEINPAAVQLASMAKFVNLRKPVRKEVFDLAEDLLEVYVGNFLPATLFRAHTEDTTVVSVEVAARQMLNEAAGDELLHSLLATSVMLAMGDGAILEAETLYDAYFKNRAIVSKLRFSPRVCEVYLADARTLPLPGAKIDLVITSPPYINVFNYHQNYRKAMESMGWRLLEIAPSEIGSNRKHRGNRFMTVVQYCMDIVRAFVELKRVLKPEGVLISVVGRESRVRGIPFYNGQLLALSAISGSGFRLEKWQERKFVNRFGKAIYEDVLTLRPDGKLANEEGIGRRIGVLALKNALKDTTEKEIRSDVEQAIALSERIQPSQDFFASRPTVDGAGQPT